jgi:triacylglycerol lipase
VSFFTKLPAHRYGTDAFARFKGGMEFRLEDAKAFAWMSQLAYETDEPEKIIAILNLWGLQLADNGIVVKETKTELPLASTRCFVATGPNTTLVAFAGTDPLVLANWISDFDIHLRETGAADGFSTAADAVWPKLKPCIGRSVATRTDVFLTGHSLGAALAALVAYRINQERLADVKAVYTFGMPRPGDSAFAAAYNGRLGLRTYRLVHGDDSVPTVAPSCLGFRHVGRYLHCDRNSNFDSGMLAPDTVSDEPLFVKGVSKQFTRVLHKPGTTALSVVTRLKLAAALLAGIAPAGVRTDLGGIAIELLPERLRDHMPDRYITACSS